MTNGMEDEKEVDTKPVEEQEEDTQLWLDFSS